MNIILYFFLLITELFILIGITIYGYGLLFSALKGAPYVPTSKKKLRDILTAAHLKKGSTFVELGSGDGRVVRFAAKEFAVKGIGIEVNPLLVWWSRFLSRRDGTGTTVTFLRKNIFNYSLAEVDFLYLFLMPALIKKLVPQFTSQLKKESLIISHGFKLEGLEKKLVHTLQDKSFSTYYYKI